MSTQVGAFFLGNFLHFTARRYVMKSSDVPINVEVKIDDPRVQALFVVCAAILGAYYIFTSQERNSLG